MFTHADLKSLLHERIASLPDADEVRPLVDSIIDADAKLMARGYKLLGDPDVFLLLSTETKSAAMN